jgi:hypothetical protein
MSRPPTIDELFIADEAGPWREAGFDVDGDVCEVASVRLRLEGPGRGRGIVAWSLRDAGSLELDGLDSSASERPPASGGAHPNGVVSIDHLVVISPDLDRTADVLRAAGFDFRRLREGETPGGSTRQAFFRMGEVILEVVAAPEGTKIASDPAGPARLWGISFLVDDLGSAATALGDKLSEPRAAVQPGRHIATLRKEAGLGPAIAFMTPGPGAI